MLLIFFSPHKRTATISTQKQHSDIVCVQFQGCLHIAPMLRLSAGKLRQRAHGSGREQQPSRLTCAIFKRKPLTISSENRNPNSFFFYFFPPKLVSCSSLTSVELRAVSWFCSSNTDAIIICAEEGMKVSLKSVGG